MVIEASREGAGCMRSMFAWMTDEVVLVMRLFGSKSNLFR